MEYEPVWGDGERAPAEEPPGGHPLLATIAACVLLLLSAGAPAGPSRDLSGEEGAAYFYGYLIGGPVVVAAVVWGIAYAITIRRSSRRWKVGSFVAILAVSLLAGAIRMGGREAALRDDARDMAAQMKSALASGDRIEQPLKAGSGPLSQMQAAMVNGMLADQQAFDRLVAASGAAQVLDATTLAPGAPVLRDCGRIEALAGAARVQGERFPAYLDSARRAAAPHLASGALTASERDSFFAGVEGARARYRRNWEINAEWAAETASLCRILGRRRWSRSGSEIVFARDSDALDANAHLSRINALVDEQQRLQAEARANARRALDSLPL